MILASASYDSTFALKSSALYVVFNQKLLREISVWTMLHDRNVTPFRGISFDFDRPNKLCLVSPYYRNGSITSYIKKQPVVDKLALVSHVTKSTEWISCPMSPQIAQIASALSYLHGLSIIHGDLKGVSTSA
jgi:serine/threonine protein kinase